MPVTGRGSELSGPGPEKSHHRVILFLISSFEKEQRLPVDSDPFMPEGLFRRALYRALYVGNFTVWSWLVPEIPVGLSPIFDKTLRA